MGVELVVVGARHGECWTVERRRQRRAGKLATSSSMMMIWQTRSRSYVTAMRHVISASNVRGRQAARWLDRRKMPYVDLQWRLVTALKATAREKQGRKGLSARAMRVCPGLGRWEAVAEKSQVGMGSEAAGAGSPPASVEPCRPCTWFSTGQR